MVIKEDGVSVTHCGRAPHEYVLFSDGPRIQQWPHNITVEQNFM